MYPGKNRRHRHGYGRRWHHHHHRHRPRLVCPLIPYAFLPHRRGLGGLFTGLMLGSIFGAAAVAHNTATKSQKRQHAEHHQQQNVQPSSSMVTEIEPGSAKSVEKQSNIINISSDEWILLPSAPMLMEEEKKEEINDDQLQFQEEGQISHSLINAANADAKQMFNALKTNDENTIARITARNKKQSQRLMIKTSYVTMDDIPHELMNDLRNTFSKINHNSLFQQLTVALYLEPGEYHSQQIFEICNDQQFNSHLLTDIICTANNVQIKQMKNAWMTHLSQGLSMTDTMKYALENKNYQYLICGILQCNRTPFSIVNENMIKSDGELLYDVFVNYQEMESMAKSKFLDIFIHRSFAHISGIAKSNIFKNMSLDSIIGQLFIDDDYTSNALRVILKYSEQPYAYWALKLRIALNGNTHESGEVINRVIVSRVEIDLKNIEQVFNVQYANGVLLKQWIMDRFNGVYQLLLISMLCV